MKKIKSIFTFKHTKKNISILIFCFIIIALSFTYCSFSAFADEPPTIKENDDTHGYVTWGNRLYTNNFRGGGSGSWYETYQFGALNLDDDNTILTNPDSKYCILLGKGSTTLLTSAGFSKTLPVQVPIVYSIDKNGNISFCSKEFSVSNDLDRHISYTGYYSGIRPCPGSYALREWSSGTKNSSTYPADVYSVPFAGSFFSNVPCFSSVDDVENYLRTGIANNADYVPSSLQCEKPLDLFVYADNENENLLTINWKQNEYSNLIYDAEVSYKIETVSMTTDLSFIPLATNKKSAAVNELSFDITPILDKALLRDNDEDTIYVSFTVNNKDANNKLIDNRSTIILKFMYSGSSWSDGTIVDDELVNHPITNKDDFISSGGSSIGGSVVSSGGIFSQLSNGLKSIISTKDGFPALIASVWSGLPPAITSILVFGFLATIIICLLAHILKG